MKNKSHRSQIGGKANLKRFSGWNSYFFEVIIFPVEKRLRRIQIENTKLTSNQDLGNLPCLYSTSNLCWDKEGGIRKDLTDTNTYSNYW